jgi:type I restriction enzyme R subunit
MNEAETRAEHIDPALKAAGWGVVEGSRVRREVITPGRIEGKGRRGKGLSADYVLVYRNRKLAVLEAKAWDKPLTEGVAQAKDYASKLQVRFAYSGNGQALYGIDRETGQEGVTNYYPTPDELWQRTFGQKNVWRDRFAAVPFPDKSGTWALRFYQEIAVNRVLDAIAGGRDRILLTLATGTGKTSIAFQVAWKLFQAHWNLGDWKKEGGPTRRPRILFLADRNTLADQAYNDFTSFSAFQDSALVRITPGEIAKTGKVPTNASVFLTIFQTFMSGAPEDGKPSPYFGEYPPDFFDFIVIDECHRGGARDESTWRDILTYFKPAVQLGLTATPKRKGNVDTYAYFGEPVYTYSLKEGINDGFLTPFRVKQFRTSLDDYTYTPDDAVVDGEVVPGKRYSESEFNRAIIIREREAHRVKVFIDLIDQKQKTLVFCATQHHALMVRDLINQAKTSTDPDYCHRVTADDGALGDQYLRDFQDNEKTVPTILTTSQKLSTGVDARNIRNIVLMRPVNSMIEFKQIIGRGTRLYEEKDYFTIYDFVEAHHHFNDSEWDGEPEDQTTDGKTGGGAGDGDDTGDTEGGGDDEDGGDTSRHRKLVIKLADGKERTLQHISTTTFWSPDGKQMSAKQFLESLFGALPDLFKDEDELRTIWSDPDTRKKLLQGLTDKGFGKDMLAEMQKVIDAEKSDLFDVLTYIAFARPPVSREDRAASARSQIQTAFDEKQRGFLDFVLSQYVREGVDELDAEKLAPLISLKYGAIADGMAELGGPEKTRGAFVGFQKYLYLSGSE